MDDFREIDAWTLRLEELLLEMAQHANAHRRQYFVGGGFAIDLSFGRLTRRHADIDFHPMEQDIDWWQIWFVNQGFRMGKDPDKRDFPHAFLVIDDEGRTLVDVHPVKIERGGEIFQYEMYGGHAKWEGKHWNNIEIVNYKGVDVHLERAESVLHQRVTHSQKYNKPLSAQHKHDQKLMNPESRNS